MRWRASRPQLKRDPLGARPHTRTTILARLSLLIVALVLPIWDGLRGPARPHTTAGRSVHSITAWVPPVLDESLATDSGFFDATGYYRPHDALTLSGHYFSSIDINSIEPYYEVHIEFEASGNARSRHECPRPLITRDTLDIRCPRTPIGTLRVAGTFRDKRGQFWNRDDVRPNETIILVARVTVESGGRVRSSQVVQFTYWAGD